MKWLLYLWDYFTIKTLYFNFKHFDFFTAIKFPVFVHRKTKFISCKGKVVLDEIKTGIIKIGYGKATYDHQAYITCWENYGVIEFRGRAILGNGDSISVQKNGKIIFGYNFRGGAKCKYLSTKGITFGKDVLLSWNIQIMDSDFHQIYNLYDNEKINENKQIIIGDHVWIGADSKILKGVEIQNDIIIASSTIVTKSINESYTIGASNKQVIIKNNVKWRY